MGTFSFTKETRGFTLVQTGVHSYSSTPIVNDFCGFDSTILESNNGVVITIETKVPTVIDIDLTTDTVEVNSVVFEGTKDELRDLLRDTVLFNDADSGGDSVSTDPDSPIQPQLAWYGSQAEYDALTPSATTIYYII